MRRYFLILIAVFFALVTALCVLASQEFTLQWLAKRAVAASQGSLVLEEVSGSLTSTIKVGKALYRTPEKEIAMQDVEVVWRPLALLLGKVQVLSVSLFSLSLDLSASDSDTPLTLPKSLALPLSLDIEAFRAEKVTYKGMLFQNVRGALDANGQRWQLKEAGLDSDFGQVSATLSLDAKRPFALKGEASINHEQAQGKATLAGRLEDMRFEGHFNGFGATVSARAKVTPFAAFVLPSLSLAAEQVDFSKVRKDWLAGRFRVAAEIQAAEDASLKGHLRFVNSEPGRLDENRLPLQSLEADLKGSIQNMHITHILLNLGKAGRFDGSGRLVDGGLALLLKTARLDLNGLDSRAKRTAIAGSIKAAVDGAQQTLTARLSQRQLALDMKAVHEAGRVEVPFFRLLAGKGELQLSGHAKLYGLREFELKGQASRFDLSTFGRYPVSCFNASVRAKGRLAADKTISLEYLLKYSRLMGKPLTGEGHFAATEKAILAANLSLAWGNNRLHAEGALDGTGKALKWLLDAPTLEALGKPFSGALFGQGQLRGSFKHWQASLKMNGKRLVLPGGVQANRFLAEGEGGNGLTDPLNMQVEVQQALIGGSAWQNGRLTVNGTLGSHIAQLLAQEGKLDLHMRVAGGWKGRQTWAGEIQTLENRGKQAFSLLSPASLQFGRRFFSLTNLKLKLTDGELMVKRLEKSAFRLLSEGYAKGLPLAYLSAFVPSIKEHVGGKLTLGATWSVEMDKGLNGKAHLYREDGDMLLKGEDNSIRLGLQDMDVRINAEKNRLQVHARLAGQTVGEIGLIARVLLAQDQKGWYLPKQSPFNLQFNADMPSLKWLGLASGQPDVETDGSLKVNVTGSGTVGAPVLTGSLAASDLLFRWATWGVRLHGGMLFARLDNGRLALEKAEINGDEGTLRVAGNGFITGGHVRADLNFLADKLLLMSAPDKQLALSGQGRFAVDDEKAALTGKWQIDKALIRSLTYNRVSFSEDVVVTGRTPDKKAEKPPLPVTMDMQVDLGDKFRIDGWGLNARLSGSLQAVSLPAQPLRIYGTVRAKEATFSAYGQNLAVKRGNVVFSGLPENPSLDILAVRKIPVFGQTHPVEAGVQVRGTPHDLQVKLISSPDMPDGEKLSWLILGHGGAQNADSRERDMVAAAATALLGSLPLGGMQSGLASRIGVDDIGISTGQDMESAVMSVSKQLSNRLYLTYEQGISTVSNLVKLRYLVSDRFRVEAATGTSSAIDLLYEWSFD